MADPDSIRSCAQCGEPIFSRLNKDGTHRKQKYCGRRCNVRAEHARHPERRYVRKPRLDQIRKPTVIYCHGCWAEVSRVVRSKKDSGRYCSQACYVVNKVRVNQEIDALHRIGGTERLRQQANIDAMVRPEIQALRRIARYVRAVRRLR